MRILEIKKLFGEHDVRVDLDRKMNILIGENGIGKTSILNIFDLVYRFDFIGLVKYKFEKINLISDNQMIVLNISDIFPDLKSILTDIHKRMEMYDNSIIAFKSFATGLDDAMRNKPNVYYEFLSDCLYDIPLSNRVKFHMNSSCYHQDLESFNPQQKIKSVLSSMMFKTNDYHFGGLNYFFNSEIEKKITNNRDFIKGIKSFLNLSMVYLNMVNQYAIKDEAVISPSIYSNMIIWLNRYQSVSSNKRFDESEESISDLLERRVSGSKEFLIGLPVFSHQKYSSDYINLLRKTYSDVEYNFFNSKRDVNNIINELVNDKVIKVNDIINRFYYSEDFMKEINNIAISYYIDLIGESYDSSNYVNANEGFSEEERSDIKNYVQPLIISESLFGSTISQVLNPSFDTNDELGQLIKRFRNFFDDNIQKIKDAKEFKIKELERILNKFITSKTFIVTPCGLKVFLKKYKEYDKGSFKVIENESNEIRLIDLSSGEKKLIIILIFSCLFDNLLLLMDEPELSFSINWQEKILPEIVNGENNNKFLIATHSPFIISNDEIANSILPLPLEG